MDKSEHKIFIGNEEVTLTLDFSDFHGNLNQFYSVIFKCGISNTEPLFITINITNKVISMWQSGVDNGVLVDKDTFAFQIAQIYLNKLMEEKKDIGIYIYRDNNSAIPDGFISIKANSSMSETARNIIFNGQKPTNNLIRREILKICYNKWQFDPYSFVSRQALLKFIPVNEVELERNLDYLKKTYYIDGILTSGGYLQVKITPQGIDLFEDPREFETRFSLKIEQQTNVIGGDLIVTELTGSNIQNVIKGEINKTE